ncbi:hypothetical protein A1Q2_00401 [Trichosporon asahii var. asahii CBS 8904]|uniref:Uncharacterized protein n=1 Tax=Trichosporon asahii var. asahii (strain CBS 8904) TaxID=1220162 RepID=K1VXN8_TRIAC|nr:hypothetical protein A1Q2_00401 [Trichosporon asahii var. asahii CBS 8904]
MFDRPQDIVVALKAHSLYHFQLGLQDAEKVELGAETQIDGSSDDEALERRVILQRSYHVFLMKQVTIMGCAQSKLRGEAATTDLIAACVSRVETLLHECNVLIEAVRQADREDRKEWKWKGSTRTTHRRTNGDVLAIQSECYDEIIAYLEETLKTMHDQYWDDELEKAHCGRHYWKGEHL